MALLAWLWVVWMDHVISRNSQEADKVAFDKCSLEIGFIGQLRPP
jgi:hypothetical protein